jgi:hypothetical protein
MLAPQKAFSYCSLKKKTYWDTKSLVTEHIEGGVVS